MKTKRLFKKIFLTSDSKLRSSDSRPRTSNYKLSHRVIALFFTFTFLNTLVPYNQLWANNNGPNAPEAAAFEPVDATDMVNLVTGDMSYVLPLLNVPSPEGGYPLALSYHAGIAMDQEASWVGLGWSLNPGAINRSVNGYPDDWGKTRVSELFYDREQTQQVYSFSIGGTLPNGLTLGMGASWGDHRAWNGVVGFAGITGNFGSEGVGLGVSIPVSGVNASINYRKKDNSLSFGVGVGALSTSMDISLTTGESSASAGLKWYGTGINFGSRNGSSSLSSSIGVTNKQTSSTQNDYHIQDIDTGFNFNVGLFWLGYRHRKYSYSLYKDTNLYVSGTLNLYNNSKNRQGGYTRDYLSIMDIKQYSADEYHNVIEQTSGTNGDVSLRTEGAIAFPNYDNYSVTAQGLSGNITPQIFEEVRLFGKGHRSETTNNDGSIFRTWIDYITDFDATIANQYNLGDKINFYFKGNNSSFLRTQTGNFSGASGHYLQQMTDLEVLNLVSTETDNTYNSNTTLSGELKKTGNRKRTGNYIETFTNQDIINNDTNGWFIKANDFDRDDIKYPLEGIGGYRITTTDGKVYHYSLPVYHFESFYKNFNNILDENASFFESKKTEPYATHWLLTAVTGPDYVDNNNNGQVDESDYGYWVEFSYGKWSDGYGWRSPKVGFKELDENQTYFWGVKQVYYLDKIKTRTHSALFVKSIRSDDFSSKFEHFKRKFTSNNHIHSDSYLHKINTPQYKTHLYNGNLYGPLGNIHPYTNNSFQAKETSWKYIDIPKNKVLKLDKVLLLKNEDVGYHKNDSQQAYGHNRTTGYSYYNDGYYEEFHQNGTALKNKPNFNRYQINRDDNILDIEDIKNTNLESKAQKVISFTHEYTLSNNIPNAESGHLTLKKVHSKGKLGIALTPPYKFSYNKSHIPYNSNNTDVWGYAKDNPDAWSLNKIETPTGGVIDIEYEEDSFYAEAAYRNRDDNTSHGFIFSSNRPIDTSSSVHKIVSIEKSETQLKINFDPTTIDFDLNLIFKIGDGIEIWPTYWSGTYTNGFANIHKSNNVYTIAEVNTNQSITLEVNELTESHEYLSFTPCNEGSEMPEGYTNCLLYLSFGSRPGLYTIQDTNGKKGGGLRVKNIKIKDEANEYITSYDYNDPVIEKISGITSYEPFDDNRIVPYIEEIPSPGVMYEYVTVSSFGNNSSIPYGSNIYHFKTLKPYNFSSNPASNEIFSLGDAFKVTQSQKTVLSNNRPKRYKHTIHNATSKLGSLISIKSLNTKQQLVGYTINNYKNYDEIDHSTGIYQSSFQMVKKRREYTYYQPSNHTVNSKEYYFYSSSKVEYPNRLKNSISIGNGFKNTTYYDEHDFLTGQVTETRTVSSDGTEFKTKVIPAYQITPYNNNDFGMGSKVDNPTNKNMLTQNAATLTQIKDETGNWKTLNADITTWNNAWDYHNYNGTLYTPTINREKIWRKHKTFTRKGEVDQDGAYVDYTGNFDNFNWSDPDNQPNPKWINTSTVNFYDHYSMPLESADINNNKASTKMGDDNTKVFAVANAGYSQVFYSGAEDLDVDTDFFGGEVFKGPTARISDKYHTGNHCIEASANVIAFGTRPDAGNYKASVWVYKGDNDNYTNTKLKVGTTSISYDQSEVVSAGDWVQLNFYTEYIPDGQVVYIYTTSGTSFFDDFRLLPVTSSMTSYVYNEWDELSYILGANNLATKYEYDDVGRLIRTKVEVINAPGVPGGFKKTQEINYNYKKVAQIDTNGNGIIDPVEFYPPLRLGLYFDNYEDYSAKAIANGIGGSGKYQYRWAIADSELAIETASYSSWGTSNEKIVSSQCDETIYVKCEVKDTETDAIVQRTQSRVRNCDGGPIIVPN